MKKRLFHEGWSYRHLGTDEEWTDVSLPHDAMTEEPRTRNSSGRHNIGWFSCRDYEYKTEFWPDSLWKDKRLILEFEGVYHGAQVWLNGEKIAERPYGYSNFYADLTGKCRFDAGNEIRVVAYNGDQPNTRWYSGAGIYRPVNLWIGEKNGITLNGIKIRTLGTEPPKIEVKVETGRSGEVLAEILEGAVVMAKVSHFSDGCAVFEVELPDARLWNVGEPNLYTCRVRFGEEVEETNFGIRSLEWNSKKGLLLNGKRVILRGACIHHDNGLLGAVCDPEAVERKVHILQENGYNALRSAHNPCSKTFLDVCDRLGMLVMDEFVDCWYIHKTKYDYVNYFKEWWQQDLKDMVDKDYNHPSVIMYSIGNEVSETAQKKGVVLTGTMTDWLHGLDGTRPVTCGINVFFNFLSSMGFGVYSDEKSEKAAKQTGKKNLVGSEFYNTLAAVLGDTTMKIGAALPPSDWKSKDAFAKMDIAGYNYGIYRYRHDLKKYPDRLILGSETFCKDTAVFWELAKKEPRIIGDFVWAGMDYIGETGTGRWDYLSRKEQPASDDMGWLSSGAGRIDILGNATAEAAYTKVAFEIERGPYIAVRPVAPEKKPPVSAWNLTDAVMSWSWRGCDSAKAEVEVYARGDQVELFINCISVGRKKINKNCRTVFHTTYRDGEVRAVIYDSDGAVIAENQMVTANEKSMLQMTAEKPEVSKGGLSYIHLRYTDDRGIWKPMEQHRLKASVRGGKLLGFGCASNYNPMGFWSSETLTYHGEAMAIVRAGNGSCVELTVRDEKHTYGITIPIS